MMSARLDDAYTRYNARLEAKELLTCDHSCRMPGRRVRPLRFMQKEIVRPDKADNGYWFSPGVLPDFGMRLVGHVVPESYGKLDGCFFDLRDDRNYLGWYDNPHGESYQDGTGLIWGTVLQLPSKGHEQRFLAAATFGGSDSVYVDTDTVFVGHERLWSAVRDHDAARGAAKAADDMARRFAEDEREYQEKEELENDEV